MIKNDVLYGKDGWLFLYQGAQFQFDFLLGKKKPSDISVNNFVNNLCERSNFFSQRGIEYKHVVFPSKPIIKKQFLMEEYSDITSLFKNHYESRVHNSNLSKGTCIYPDKLLIDEEKHNSTFRKLNTHNTGRGYLAITNALMLDLNETLNLSFTSETKNIGGDLVNMIDGSMRSDEEVLSPNMDSIFHIGNRPFLIGNSNEVSITFNKNSQSDKKLLIFGDSFFKESLIFLWPYFKTIVYFRSQFVHEDIVDMYKPDVVFSGNAERYLSHVRSDTESSNILLSMYGDQSYKPNATFITAFKAVMSCKYYPKFYDSWCEKLSQ
jgi:hypothetical protein